MSPRAEVIDLDRTEVRRISSAVEYLVERHGTRREVERVHGISGATIATLIRGAQPWRITSELLSKVAGALGLKPEDVLHGRAPAPRSKAARTPTKRARRPAERTPVLPPFSAKVLAALETGRAYSVADIREAIEYTGPRERAARSIQGALRMLKRRGLVAQSLAKGAASRGMYSYSRVGA